MLRDAYVRAIVALHFPTFERVRRERDSLAQVRVVLPRPAFSRAQWELAAADAVANASTILIALDVKIPLVVQAPPGGTKLGHRALPLISRTAFFRIMEGQVLEALNVQRAWPEDLEQWRAEEVERSVGDRIHEARQRSPGPRHIRDILAPLITGPKTAWSEWLRSSARSLDRQERSRRRYQDREER